MKIENNQILLEGKWMDLLYLYQFIRRLTTPFDKTSAFKLGIIDKDGNVLRKRNTLTTPEEKDAYTYFDTLVFNLKKLLGKLPFGKTTLASFVAGLLLLREEKSYKFQIMQEQDKMFLEREYIELYETVSKNKELIEHISEIRSMLNEERLKRKIGEMMGTAAVPTTQQPTMTPSAVKKYHSANTKGLPAMVRRKAPLLDDYKTPADFEDSIRDRVESAGDYKVFKVDTKTFQKARVQKTNFNKYSRRLGESLLTDEIRSYASQNPSKPVIIMDESTGMIHFLRYGTEGRTSFNQYCRQ